MSPWTKPSEKKFNTSLFFLRAIIDANKDNNDLKIVRINKLILIFKGNLDVLKLVIRQI